MGKAMLRVKTETRDAIRTIADGQGATMQQVVDEAVEAYRRQLILDESNAAYARLRESGEAWEEYVEEQRVWDATLAEGL